MLPSRGERDAVLGAGQVLGREPEVDGVLGDLVERERRRELRLDRLLAAEHRRGRLADHLDVAHRVLEAGHPEVEVVDAERLLELRRVRLLRDRQDRRAVVEHVVAADLVGAVGEAVRVAVVGRREQQRRRVRGAGRHDDDVAAERRPARPRGRPRRRSRSCPRRRSSGCVAWALVRSVTFGCSSAGRTPKISASDLAMHERREAVAGRAADARRCSACRPRAAGCRTARGTGGSRPARGRRTAAGSAARASRPGTGRPAGTGLGRILGVVAVDLVELLGLRVVRLEVVVRDGPRGRDPVVVLELAEVLLPEPVERRAVELGLAADVVVDARAGSPCRWSSYQVSFDT